MYAQDAGIVIQRILVVERNAFCRKRYRDHSEPVVPALAHFAKQFQ